MASLPFHHAPSSQPHDPVELFCTSSSTGPRRMTTVSPYLYYSAHRRGSKIMDISEVDVKDEIESHVYEVSANSEDDLVLDDDDYVADDDDIDTLSRNSTVSNSPTLSKRSIDLTADDPSREACNDIGSFLRKYYLDTNGLPDPAKTPQTLCLRGLTKSQLSILSHIFNDNFIDLYWHVCGNRNDKILCVGWDRADVRRTADEFDSKRYERRAQAYARHFSMPDSIPEENV